MKEQPQRTVPKQLARRVKKAASKAEQDKLSDVHKQEEHLEEKPFAHQAVEQTEKSLQSMGTEAVSSIGYTAKTIFLRQRKSAERKNENFSFPWEAKSISVHEPTIDYSAKTKGLQKEEFTGEKSIQHVVKEYVRMPKILADPFKENRPTIQQISAKVSTNQRRLRQPSHRAAHIFSKMARAIYSTAASSIAALKSLAAAIVASGGIAMVVILLVCLLALVMGSAFGIFFSTEPTGKGMTLKQAAQILNGEFYERVEQIQQTVPHDRIEYESTDGSGSVSIAWEDVLSVFACDVAAADQGQQVVALNESQVEQLRNVLWDMNQINERTYEESHTEEIWVTNEEGEKVLETQIVTETVLVVEFSHRTPQEMVQHYGFSQRQKEQLTLLADPQYDALWMELLGGYVSGGGQIMDPDSDWIGTDIFAWPLPQNFSITSSFGYRQDPFTGEISYHGGTDIAAPAGTPILASAAGTVMVANGTDPWGGSYGYHVKLDHGNGLESLYAHCQAVAVTVGQQVQQGEVIGYVGSTGNSTGNHLHFEVRVNGERVDAMKYFTVP